MKTVWKEPLLLDDLQTLTVREGSKPLLVRDQHGVPTLWYLTDPEVKGVEDMKIRTAGTGHLITEEIIQYLGTIFVWDGDLVLHYFWVK